MTIWTEPLTENERKMISVTFAGQGDAGRWGKHLLRVYDATLAELRTLKGRTHQMRAETLPDGSAGARCLYCGATETTGGYCVGHAEDENARLKKQIKLVKETLAKRTTTLRERAERVEADLALSDAALERIADLHSSDLGGDPDTFEQATAALGRQEPPWENRFERDLRVAEEQVALLRSVVNAYSEFDDVIACLSDARRSRYQALLAAKGRL